VPNTTRREAIFGIVCGVAVLGFVIYGVMTMSSHQEKASGNTLSGTVVGRKFTPQQEDQVSFGRAGVSGQKLAGEYVFMVHVKSENRTFEVPVDPNTYEAVRDGANFTFLRPRSEQQK